MDAIPAHRPMISALGTSSDFLAILKRLTDASPADTLAARLMIEPRAAAAAVSSASGADLQAIRDAHEQAVAQTDLAGFEHWDAELHRLIYAATRNELLISLHDVLGVIRNRSPWLRLKKKVITEAKRIEYCQHHQEIVDCICERNSEGASTAMRRHITVIIEDLFPPLG